MVSPPVTRTPVPVDSRRNGALTISVCIAITLWTIDADRYLVACVGHMACGDHRAEKDRRPGQAVVRPLPNLL